MKFLSTAVVAVVAACAMAPAMAQEPVILKIVMPSGPDSIDPCDSPRSVVSRIFRFNVVEPLVELDPITHEAKPRLAESWSQISPTVWQFKLRPGVVFHDGSPLTAEAVVHSLERTLDETLTCITRTQYFGGVSITAKALDDLTVEFTTAEPRPILPTLLAKLAISSLDTPVGVLTDKPIGTGPFKFDTWVQNEKVEISKFDHYWGEEPAVDGAVYMWRAESSVAAAMVETGEADIAFSIAPQDATNPETDKVYLNAETTVLRPSNLLPPFDDIRVRKALNLAIDRNAFLGSIISDKAQLAMQQVGPSVLGFNPNLKQWPYDPEQAMKLLAEAKADGVPVDQEIVLVGRPGLFSNSNEFAEAIAEMLRAVGFNIKLDSLELKQWLTVANKPFDPTRPVNILLSMHDNNTGDASFTAFFKYHSTGRQSVTVDAEVDRLLDEAAGASGAEREKLYQEVFYRVSEVLVQDAPLFHMVNYMRVGSRVDFTPTIGNAAELQLSQIGLK
jgi:peptide/nickel transport system substrate-binding protein